MLKDGPYTDSEREIMQKHAVIGYATLLKIHKSYPKNVFLELALSIAHSHHEKWDGSGYPIGLQGEEIPLAARIMAIADVYDALRSERVYKKAFSHQESLDIMKSKDGTHFDSGILRVFLENATAFANIFDAYSE